jgi:PAS domain S-box-containing protein
MAEGLRLLLVEDAPDDAQLIVEELRRGGGEPTARRVETEEELGDALRSGPWDVVICDWSLPGFSAPRAIDVVKEAGFDGPIVVVSGAMGEEHAVEAMRSGADDYVVKNNLGRLSPAIERELSFRAAARQAEGRLAVSEEALRRQALIFENLHDAVVVVDLEGRIVDLNPGAEVMFGRSKDEAVGRVPSFLGDSELITTAVSAVAREGRWSGEVPLRRTDGAPRLADLVLVPLKDADGRMLGTVGVLRDVTDRRRSEREMSRTLGLLRASDRERRQLVSRLVAAQEEEAQRIAGEIHDDPIQQLSAVSLRVGMLRKEVDEQKRTDAIVQIQEAVDETLIRLRRMLFELSPRTLETGGLGQALREYVQFANQEDATLYRLQDELTKPLDQEKRTIAYRVILEALSNVRKHAAAPTAVVSISDRHGCLLCGVSDAGNGIAPEAVGVSMPGHMGTASMRQRVELAGGWIEMESRPGLGTTVEFWLPGD